MVRPQDDAGMSATLRIGDGRVSIWCTLTEVPGCTLRSVLPLDDRSVHRALGCGRLGGQQEIEHVSERALDG